MVVTEQEAATQARLTVLRRGGNAMDAAVTAMFVLGVVKPAACGIGGGGILLVDRPGWPAPKAIDFTMTAPQMATDAFELLDEHQHLAEFGWRKVRGDASNLAGFSAAATPGFVAGLALALRQFGTLSPSDVLPPAIHMAETGVETPWTTTLRISASLRAFAAYPDSMATFAPNGVPLNPGGAYSKPDLLVQPALARTLRTLASEGLETFYRGSIGAQIDRGMRDNGGLVTAADLAASSRRYTKPWRAHRRGLGGLRGTRI